jgi:hypothetical protein
LWNYNAFPLKIFSPQPFCNVDNWQISETKETDDCISKHCFKLVLLSQQDQTDWLEATKNSEQCESIDQKSEFVPFKITLHRIPRNIGNPADLISTKFDLPSDAVKCLFQHKITNPEAVSYSATCAINSLARLKIRAQKH